MSSPLRNFSLSNADGTAKTAEQLQSEADQLVRDARARAERMRAQLDENVVEATSRNQAATVSVQATGALQSVRLNDRIKSMSPVAVAASVMEAYQEATRQAAARTTEIAATEIGDERLTSMMRDLLPDFAKPEED